MSQVIVSPCRQCGKSLRIPPQWIGQPIKCKFCGHQMLVAAKGGGPGPMSQGAYPSVAAHGGSIVPGNVGAPVVEALPDDLPEYTPGRSREKAKSSYVSAYSTNQRYSGGRYKRGGPSKFKKLAGIAFVLLLIMGGAFAAIYFGKDKLREIAQNPKKDDEKNTTPVVQNTPQAKIFPRRMLAISVHSYLYANPLHNGDTGDSDPSNRTGTDASIRKLAEYWRIPKSQVYHLTDAKMVTKDVKGKPAEKKTDEAAEGPVRRVPLKNVIEGALEQFCETSRPQDRVVILFAGHAIEKDGKAYLVPLEGDFDDLESLIPLEAFYQKVNACKAQEKTVIFDVCRYHPDRGAERPHFGKMTEAMEKALHNGGDGVTVLTSCSANEQSYELDYAASTTPGTNGYSSYGGFFLGLVTTMTAQVKAKKLPEPEDEIPIDVVSDFYKEKIPLFAKSRLGDEFKQTPKVTLKKATTKVDYNASEAMASTFEFPKPPESADKSLVMSILNEIDLPPIKALRADAPPPTISDVLPFKKEVLQPFLSGAIRKGDKIGKFQEEILAAVATMKDLGKSGSKRNLPEEFRGENSDAVKERLKNVQKVPAELEIELQDLFDKLLELEPMKKDQTPRWQLHYDYVLAQLKLRICYVNQYNLALANYRAGKVAELTKEQDGYRLTAETALEKTTLRTYKDMYEEAKKTMQTIAKDHPGTPWALLAKSDKTVAIGLKISPTTFGGR